MERYWQNLEIFYKLYSDFCKIALNDFLLIAIDSPQVIWCPFSVKYHLFIPDNWGGKIALSPNILNVVGTVAQADIFLVFLKELNIGEMLN